MTDAELDQTIRQLGENAAKAQREYAERERVLVEALKKIAGNNWRDQSRARHVAREALAKVGARDD